MREIEKSAVVGTSDGVSLVLWDMFGRRCRVTTQCDAMCAWPLGAMGDTVGADRYIRVHVYIVVAFYGALRALRAHRAGIGFYTHTYAILLTRT